jgi:hypothetical protein
MSLSALSFELDLLKRQFQPFAKTGLAMSGPEVKRLTQRISVLSKLSKSLETELSVHRLTELGRAQAATLEALTIETAGNLILAAEGNVIRPDFTKGSRS